MGKESNVQQTFKNFFLKLQTYNNHEMSFPTSSAWFYKLHKSYLYWRPFQNRSLENSNCKQGGKSIVTNAEEQRVRPTTLIIKPLTTSVPHNIETSQLICMS